MSRIDDSLHRGRRGRSHLAELADPSRFTDALEVFDEPAELLISDLYKMIEIRLTEEAIADMVKSGEARCPCHLAIGQEAIAVGVSRTLRRTDRIFGNHRSHGQYLAAGGSKMKLLAEVLGRDS